MRLLVCAVLMSAILLIGCGGYIAPDWFDNIPADAHHLYAAGAARSMDMQMAIGQAQHCARVEIARQVVARTEQVRSQMISTVVLKGSKVVKQEIKQEKKFYHAYVLMKMPFDNSDFTMITERDLAKYMNSLQAFGGLGMSSEKRWLKALDDEVKKQKKKK